MCTMQNEIMFFQSTNIGGNKSNPGLFELFSGHLDGLENVNIFEKIQVIVPNHAMAQWLRDNVTKKFSICANIDFVVLPGPVIENIYKCNNPTHELLNLQNLKYLIYEYLCQNKLDLSDNKELKYYIYGNGEIDIFRVFQLSCQLQQILMEYLYLRTNELLNLDKSNFPNWQKQIINHLFKHQNNQKTFLDIYSYFNSVDLSNLQLPTRLFIFGLTSIYPSQLQIIKKLANDIDIYWYYQPCSFEYYGDLLSDNTRQKLESKLLNDPYLSLDDLYLTDGNPMLANLGQQSREFIELLQANDITVYDFNPKNSLHDGNTILSILQNDIREIKYRIKQEYRLHEGNMAYYADPVNLKTDYKDCLYDLSYNQVSIKINSCHNKMREVQVLFNEIVNILNSDNHVKLTDILICAPDIDEYSKYIKAVFDNEVAVTANSLSQHKILYNITGNRVFKDTKILNSLKLIINAPYNLSVTYFMEILSQIDIGITQSEIELVKKWFFDNSIFFGYTSEDYAKFGYTNYSVHTFKHLLNNIVLGACMNEAMYNERLPIYFKGNYSYCPYDNIDSSQINLCNKLIILINILEDLRNEFYINENTQNQISLEKMYVNLEKIYKIFQYGENGSTLLLDSFLGTFLQIKIKNPINLSILNIILDDYIKSSAGKVNFDGRITCASISYMRNIPYSYIFILGMNFGEFPTVKEPNQLSILAKEWYLADRNYNNEDKQAFLDVILSAQKAICFSYVGRRETDNSEIKPSPVLSLLKNTIGCSFTNFEDVNENNFLKFNFKNLVVQQSLHPFYNNQQPNYSYLWSIVASNSINNFIDRRWDFSKVSPITLNQEQEIKRLKPEIKDIVDTFLYTNNNLYKTIGVSKFNNELELSDKDDISLFSRKLAANIYPIFEKYKDKKNLFEFMLAKGIIGYAHMGKIQFDYYLSLYNKFIILRGESKKKLSLKYVLKRGEVNFTVEITGEVLMENSNIIITPAFSEIKNNNLVQNFNELPYKLKILGMVTYLLLKNGASLDNEIIHGIQNVVIRQINANGESSDLLIKIKDLSLINKIISYYLRSTVNPVLVHKGAIEEYVDSKQAVHKDGNNKYTFEQVIERSRKKYTGTFNNFDLDYVKQDLIFSNIADNYFDVISACNGVNDIIQIGEILSSVSADTNNDI